MDQPTAIVPPPAVVPTPGQPVVWYGSNAQGQPTGPYLTVEELDRAQDVLGCYGGEVEHLPHAGLYRCPDFDNHWRAWPNVNAAVEYYEQLARG